MKLASVTVIILVLVLHFGPVKDDVFRGSVRGEDDEERPPGVNSGDCLATRADPDNISKIVDHSTVAYFANCCVPSKIVSWACRYGQLCSCSFRKKA